MKGIKMFSIIDGHSGWACAQLVSQTLHPMILLSLRSLYAGYPPPTTFTHRLAGSNMSTSAHLMEYISSLGSKLSAVVPFLGKGNSISANGGAEVNPTTMKNSIISAFLTLDDQIITSATRLIPHIPTQPGKPNLRPIVQPMLAPAVSGACAINLLVDEEREEVYVSNTGDCRAVAGVWVEPNPSEGKEGGWRCEVLSEDMMGDNPAEVDRSVFSRRCCFSRRIAQVWLIRVGVRMFRFGVV
jgi:pyruvate dehydrogenase phosphatase